MKSISGLDVVQMYSICNQFIHGNPNVARLRLIGSQKLTKLTTGREDVGYMYPK